MNKKLSRLMLISAFLSNIFYAVSYPYIYQQTVAIVPRSYIGIEQILPCIGVVVFCRMWNKYSDKLFRYYRVMLWAEIVADIILFANVLITHDLKFYFLLNVIIYSIVTRCLCCGGTKMRALVHPTDQERERYDNNVNIICSVATLMSSGFAIACPLSIDKLFVLAFIGNIIDNIFYLYIYRRLIQSRKVGTTNE